MFASWASRIPDVKHLLHLNNGQLGSILLAIPLGQLLMMGFSGVLVSKLGSKKMLVVAEVFYAAVLFAMGCSSTVFHLTLSLVGFGISSSVPICYSIAGKLGTVKASIAITIVSSISFFGFLVGPPVIGWLAEAFNLRVALSIASLLGLIIAILSRRVKNRQ